MCIVGNRGDFFFFIDYYYFIAVVVGVFDPIFGSLYVSFFSCTST
jgi:hypothetical protein